MSSSSVQLVVKLTIEDYHPTDYSLKLKLEMPMAEFYVQDDAEICEIQQAWIRVHIVPGVVTQVDGIDSLSAWPDFFKPRKYRTGYETTPTLKRLLAVALAQWKKEN